MFVRTTELDDAPAEHGASGSGGWSPSAGAHGSRAGPATRRLNGSARAALSPRLALSSQRRIARNEPGRNMDVVQIKVKLRGVSKPPVWRRLQVRADTSLDRLHEAILAAFGWAGYHMHVFESGADRFGLPDSELGFADERRVTVGELVSEVGDQL